MSDSESDANPVRPSLPDDHLPPVEPPSARFIVQLFVIPGVIVVAIVAVWLMFSWIAHRTSARPEDVIQGLSGSGPARWQRASELADMLRSDRYREFRQNSAAARQLAALLERELEEATTVGGMERDAVNLRYFLCRALGEFDVTDGVEVLLSAATTDRDPRELWMRRGAIQALAVLAYRQLQADPPREFDPSPVVAALIALAGNDEELIRSEAAYTLGRIATPEALAKLEIMVDDPHADTRYNAAVALAEQGNPKALETLVEMLDPAESPSVAEEIDESLQLVKRALIMKNAMHAVVELARARPEADLADVRESLAAIVATSPADLHEAHIDPLVQAEAHRTLEFLEERVGNSEETISE